MSKQSSNQQQFGAINHGHGIPMPMQMPRPNQPIRHDQRAAVAQSPYYIPIPPGYAEIMSALHGLTDSVAKLVDGQAETKDTIQKVAKSIETSHVLVSNNIVTRSKKIFDRIGKQDESVSALSDRLQKFEYGLEELLERTRDPFADGELTYISSLAMADMIYWPVAARPQRDMAISTERDHVVPGKCSCLRKCCVNPR